MVRWLLIAAALASGCVIRTTRARDATLYYHATLDELRTAPAIVEGGAATPPALPPAIAFDAFVAAYPQPIGLDYDDDGAFRRVTGVEWSAGEVEAALARALPSTGDAALHAHGAVVSLAVYRVGGSVYGRAILELRVADAGSEVYAARYTAELRGEERQELFAALANDLVKQIARDARLVAARPGGAS